MYAQCIEQLSRLYAPDVMLASARVPGHHAIQLMPVTLVVLYPSSSTVRAIMAGHKTERKWVTASTLVNRDRLQAAALCASGKRGRSLTIGSFA
jgi:hypothetical protein